MNPLFIVLEGMNGVGKTTQLQLLEEHFKMGSRDVVSVKEPGSTPIGEKLRILLKDDPVPMHPNTQIALFLAARTELAHTVILPALDRGKVVLADRWTPSTLVYQCYSLPGMLPEDLLAMSDLLMFGIKPDVTVILDLPLDEAIKRRAQLKEKLDRFEQAIKEFQHRVEIGYRVVAASFKECRMVNATGSRDQVHGRILSAIKDVLDKKDKLQTPIRPGS